MICSSVNLLFLMTPHSYSQESENSWLSFRVSRQRHTYGVRKDADPEGSRGRRLVQFKANPADLGLTGLPFSLHCVGSRNLALRCLEHLIQPQGSLRRAHPKLQGLGPFPQRSRVVRRPT